MNTVDQLASHFRKQGRSHIADAITCAAGELKIKDDPIHPPASGLRESLRSLLFIHDCVDETGYVAGVGFYPVAEEIEKARAALAGEGGGWIPLSERKPTEADANTRGDVMWGWASLGAVSAEKWHCNFSDRAWPPSHWMPCPPQMLQEQPPVPAAPRIKGITPDEIDAAAKTASARGRVPAPAPAEPEVSDGRPGDKCDVCGPGSWFNTTGFCDRCGAKWPVIIPAPAPSTEWCPHYADLEKGYEVGAGGPPDPQSPTGEREAFEKWAESEGYNITRHSSLTCNYVSDSMNLYWDVWQAGAAWAASGDSLQRVVEWLKKNRLASFHAIQEACAALNINLPTI